MSVKKTLSLNNSKSTAVVKVNDRVPSKQPGFNKCFSFMEISMEPAGQSLREMDSYKLKAEIKRWAKAVVAYAHKVSSRLGSSRRDDYQIGSRSSRESSQGSS